MGVLGVLEAGGDGRGMTRPCMVAILLIIICACCSRCCSCSALNLCLMLRQKGTRHRFSWHCMEWARHRVSSHLHMRQLVLVAGCLQTLACCTNLFIFWQDGREQWALRHWQAWTRGLSEATSSLLAVVCSSMTRRSTS